MATVVFKDAYVMINSVDLSEYVQEVELPYEATMLDDTAMGDDTESSKPGLKKWSITVKFIQDFATEKVDATLYPLVGAAAFPIVVKPDGDTTSVTNPKFTGNAVLESYPPFGGKVGDLLVTTAVLRSAGTLSRATSDA